MRGRTSYRAHSVLAPCSPRLCAGARRGGKRRRSEGAEGEGEPGSSERPAKQPAAAKPAKQESPAAGGSTPLSWPPKGTGGSAGAGHKSGAPAAAAAGSGGRGKEAGAAAAAPGAKREGGKAPTPTVPARPLIPRKAPASGSAAAGASSSAAARGGGDRLVLHFRFPKDYPIPTKASVRCFFCVFHFCAFDLCAHPFQGPWHGWWARLRQRPVPVVAAQLMNTGRTRSLLIPHLPTGTARKGSLGG